MFTPLPILHVLHLVPSHLLYDTTGFDLILVYVSRKGGLSGRARYNKHLLDFLKKKHVFPRPSQFVKLIDHGYQWECPCITPYHPDTNKEGMKREIWNICHLDALIDETHPFRTTKAFYTPPWPGGQVKMTAELVTKYPFLHWFADINLQSAYILKYLNGRSW